jgi:hypothetical protein
MKRLNKITLCLLSVLCILSITGYLNFGHGLGNLFLILPVILLTLLHLFITLYLLRKKDNSLWLPMILFFGITCFYIIYKSTLGRGGEFAWDGNIFFVK